MSHNEINRILRCSEILEILSIGESTLYAWIAEGHFPRPLQLGGRTTGWRQSTVLHWLDNLQDTAGQPQQASQTPLEDQ